MQKGLIGCCSEKFIFIVLEKNPARSKTVFDNCLCKIGSYCLIRPYESDRDSIGNIFNTNELHGQVENT